MFSAPEAYWIRIRTKSGRWVGGRMTKGSSTSMYPREREIFIATEHRMDEDGKFQERIGSTAGVWIPGLEIETLELLRGKKDGKNVE
jgi:hypothetical protein